MEIKISNLNYQNIFKNLTTTIESNTITGIIGHNYDQLLYLLGDEHIILDSILYNNNTLDDKKKNYIGYMGKNISFLTDNVYNEMLIYLNKNNIETSNPEKRINKSLVMVGLSPSIIDKSITKMSMSNKKLLMLALILVSNPNIIVIDEPFINIDFLTKKTLKNVFRDLKNKYDKTIIIGSNDPNLIYECSEKCLFVKSDEVLYDDVKKIFTETNIKKYKISMPNLVKFTNLAKNKNINLSYHQDIRDLIKDVYKHV